MGGRRGLTDGPCGLTGITAREEAALCPPGSAGDPTGVLSWQGDKACMSAHGTEVLLPWLLGALGPPMPKERVVKCWLKKKSNEKASPWELEVVTKKGLNRSGSEQPIGLTGSLWVTRASCASPFQHRSFSESPVGEPVLHARGQTFTQMPAAEGWPSEHLLLSFCISFGSRM